MSKIVVNRIIDQRLFEHYFQPIFDLKNEKYVGVELLLRTMYGPPKVIFQQAKFINKLFGLDTLSIMHAMKKATYFQNQFLFLNVFYSTVKNPIFIPLIEDYVERNNINCEKIILIVKEVDTVEDLALLVKQMNRLKELGFMIACDHVGKDTKDLAYLGEFNLNLIKLDDRFSKNLIKSPKKRNFISSLLEYCQLNQIKVILGGIENEETMVIAKELGLDLAQGLYFGVPKRILGT